MDRQSIDSPTGTPAVGAFDADGWAGLVVCDGPGRGTAVRLVAARNGERADGADLLNLVHEVGPCAADGSYARVSFDLDLPFGAGDDTPILERAGRTPGLVWEWSRVAPGRVVGRARLAFAGHVEVRGYFPWDWAGEWTVEDGRLVGRWAEGRIARLSISGPRTGRLGADGARIGARAILDPSGEAGLRCTARPGSAVYLTLDVGDADRAVPSPADPSAIDTALSAAATRYETTRVETAGHWRGLASSITNNLHWMVLLQPETGRVYTPAGRRWVFPRPDGDRDHWTIFAWDAFFNALELAVESPALAAAATRSVLATQYPNGNVPNWRGRFGGTPDRSQPPVGAFAVLKQFLRTRNRSLLDESWSPLERWSAWWRAPKGNGSRRDGNGNGLFNWGSDVHEQSPTPPPWEAHVPLQQYAAWESGQDDLPNWDDAGWSADAQTMELDAVDLNALVALDLECMARIAHFRGDRDGERAYRGRYDALRRRMNERLWCEDRGLYVDRHWDGTFSRRVAASNFLPLLAGIPDRERADRMVRVLTDPQWFWGPFVVPTIARTDPAFADQQYWRGSIWPPTNYLIYQGLRRYRFDAVAGELAARSVDLFLHTWRTYQLCRENFDSRTGHGAGHRFQSWGPLFALMGIEEFIDVTPWDGVRIGTIAPPPTTTLRRLRLLGHEWTVTVGPAGLAVSRDGTRVLTSTAPVVLRHVRLGGDSLHAETYATGEVTLDLHGRGGGEARIDDDVCDASGGTVTVPPGTHRLRVGR